MKHRPRVLARPVLGTLALLLLTVGMRADAADQGAGRIERIELTTDGAATKVLIMLSRPLAFDVHVLDGDAARKSARRLVLDFANTTLAPSATKPIEVANDLLGQVRPGQFNAKTARIVLDLASGATHSVDAVETPPHVTIVLVGTATGATPPAPAETTTGMLPSTTGAATTGPAPATAAPAAAGALSTADTAAVAAPPAGGGSEASRTPARTIPIRARGRRPYSLNYWR